MFNVLPEIFKEEIRNDYKSHRTVVVLVFIMFLQITFLVLLFPSWLNSSYKENDIISQTKEISTSPSAQNTSSITNVVTTTNARLAVVSHALNYQSVIPLLRTILDNKLPGIEVNQFLYTSNSPTESTLSLQGVSADRETLVSFVKKLQDSGAFSSVNLPVSNYAKDKDIQFSISLMVGK